MKEGVLFVSLEKLVFESAFEAVMFDFVEAIHVELSDEAVHFVVTEVARQDHFFELDYVLDDEFESIRSPVDNLLVLLDLNIERNTSKI